MTYVNTIVLLVVSLILLITTMYITLRVPKKTQVQKMMVATNILLINWCVVAIFEETWRNTHGNNINMFLINLTYLSICFLPIFIFLFGLFFVKSQMKFPKKYLLLFIVPIITTIIIWTNGTHHWFFDNYSVYSSEATYGWYYFLHSIYSYGLIFIGIYLLLSYSIRNAGLFSRQSILMIIGILVPLGVNIAYSFNLYPLTFNINPIAFTIWSFFTTIALQKFKLLNIVPIALQKVVDCMSDSYIVVNNELEYIDCNKSFLDKMMQNSKIKKSERILEHMKEKLFTQQEYEFVKECITESINKNKLYSFEQEIQSLGVFNIDINPIISDGKVIGAIVLFKDITELKRSQNTLIEQERLASLGQLAGGMAHDINTPIATIRMGIDFLGGKHEYTEQEGKMLEAMKISASKITEIVESVRNQIRNTGESQKTEFLLSKVIDNIKILVNNELNKNSCKLLVDLEDEITLFGDFGKLSQVVMNIVMNAIQAYNGQHGEIKLKTYKENNNVIISVSDNAGGIPKKIADGLFKEILTTKGTKGTGFGLYFSKSMVKAEFNGDISFETKEGDGSIFYITIPLDK